MLENQYPPHCLGDLICPEVQAGRVGCHPRWIKFKDQYPNVKWYNPADKGKGDKKFRSSKGTDKVDDKYKRGKEAKEHIFKNRSHDRTEIKDKKKQFKRGSGGRFQINVVDAEEEHDEWFDIDSLSALAPGTLPVEVPVGNDVDGDLEMELGQGTNPEDVSKVELNFLEQAKRKLNKRP